MQHQESNHTQEVEVAVEGVITRLMPCALHAGQATGEHVMSNEKCIANPNGYHHDCPACATTPTKQEALERTVTRHAI